jgi:glycosyltransferase involved in cell wall biosynthesis
MKTRTPFVSIIIPTYNRKEKLLQTIESIRHQTYPSRSYEVIVIDDCSSDDTSQTLKRLKKNSPRLISLRNSTNKGPAFSRNKGIRLSRGIYIFFLDDDCIAPSHWISHYVHFLEKHPSIGVVGGPLQPAFHNFISKIESFKNFVLGLSPLKKRPLVGFTSNSAYRKIVFDTLGYFDETNTLPGGEDYDFCSYASRHYKTAYLSVPLVHNQAYDIHYILNIVYKQGLHRSPPSSLLKKIALLFFFTPLLIYNIVKKTLAYRSVK